jgi:hypothetical protein
VHKPVVDEVVEWNEADRRVRAELMTLAPGTRISEDMALRRPVELDHTWWEQLRSSLDALAAYATERVCLDEQFVHRRLLAAFGIQIDAAQLEWTTAHGDLHWANVTAPQCWLLDWESWGTAPTGYDAALLLGTSLLQSDIAAQVRAVFAEVLDTPGGQLAQLLAAAKLLSLVDYGDHQSWPFLYIATPAPSSISSVFVGEQVTQEHLRLVEEGPGQRHRPGRVVIDVLDRAVFVDLEDPGPRHGQQHRRVRGDHELAAVLDELPNSGQRGQASADRQRGLGLV